MRNDPKIHIQNLFGFSFPEDFFQFNDWLQKHKQIKLQDDLEIDLLEIFNVFEEDFSENNLFDFVHKFRYYDDPPEFVGLFRGFTDGLHWGYYFDSPEEFPPIIVSYYHSDSYEMTVEGHTIFEALRKLLEDRTGIDEDNYDEDPTYYGDRAKIHQSIRPLLLPFMPNRPEMGEAYIDKYSDFDARNQGIIAPTYHQLGILAPPKTYKKIDEIPYQLEPEQIENYISLAYECLKEGFPATALQIAHNFWLGKRKYREQVNDLFKKSYEQLNRKSLIPLLEVAIGSRQAFDKENEAREKAVLERIELFEEGMLVRFRQYKGQILSMEGKGASKKALIQFEEEAEAKFFLLKDYAFHFRIPSDWDFYS